MCHRGDLGALGEDGTIGHQNKRPATRKHISSKICIPWERMPNWNASGRCHPITAAVPASQYNTGR